MTKVKMAHASLQYSDSDKQHEKDVKDLFDRAAEKKWGWLTGTEAGPGAGQTSDLLVKHAKRCGFKSWVPSARKGPGQNTDCWVAVNKDLVTSNWKTHYELVIPGSKDLGFELPIRFGPKGLIWCEWESEELGHVSVNASHYLTKARQPGSKQWSLNKKLGLAISDWAVEQGKGKDLVFYGGDQNMADNKNQEPQGDTFFGGPLLSAWDELEHWESTGHGNIDVIASYNKDKRVKAVSCHALDDKQFFQHSDHFVIEAVYEVGTLA